VARQRAGKLINPLAWRAALPDPVFHGLERWVGGQAFDLKYRRWRTGGLSGSLVASVTVQPFAGMVSGAILKIVPPDVDEQPSASNYAIEDSPPGFATEHLTRTRYVGELPGVDGTWLHLQDVAQSGVATMLALRDLIGDEDLAEHCATILSTVATGWNPGDRDPDSVDLTPVAFLRVDLAGRAERLRAFARAAGWDPDRPQRMIMLPGRPDPLPNPLRFLDPAAVDGTEVEFARGRGHGDLNADNVLIPVVNSEVRAAGFRLIDLGRYSPEAYIARDPAKLLLSLAALWLPGMTPGSAIRSSLAELVVAPQDFPASPSVVGFLHVARRIREAAAEWAVRRNLTEQWDDQFRLGIAAAALRTVARADIGDADRWWHLEVAALALRPFAGSGETTGEQAPTPPTAARPAAGEVRHADHARADVKAAFKRDLGADWQDLAAILEIPPHERALFPAGNEGGYIWDLLESRGELALLRPALINIGRADLARNDH
jgi:hypothetical protein